MRAKCRDLLRESIEPRQQLFVVFISNGRLPALHVERPVRFKDAPMDIAMVLETLAMNNFDQFLACESFALQCLAIDVPVVDQDSGTSFEGAVQSRGVEEKPNHDPIDGKQAEGANQTAGHRIVVADDGVLHRVREREQHDQIERIQLRELALAEQSEQQDQRQVYNYGAQELFNNRNRQMKHAVEDGRKGHASEDIAGPR
jgi:hypothetical protein